MLILLLRFCVSNTLIHPYIIPILLRFCVSNMHVRGIQLDASAWVHAKNATCEKMFPGVGGGGMGVGGGVGVGWGGFDVNTSFLSTSINDTLHHHPPPPPEQHYTIRGRGRDCLVHSLHTCVQPPSMTTQSSSKIDTSTKIDTSAKIDASAIECGDSDGGFLLDETMQSIAAPVFTLSTTPTLLLSDAIGEIRAAGKIHHHHLVERVAATASTLRPTLSHLKDDLQKAAQSFDTRARTDLTVAVKEGLNLQQQRRESVKQLLVSIDRRLGGT